MGDSIKNKTIKGIKWTSIYTVFNTISYPLYQVILAMLLLPSDFAYIAIISLFINLSLLLNNMGISEAVIQRDNVSSSQISTLFYFNLFISFLIAGFLYFISPYIEQYYELENLESIIKLIIITIILNGAGSIFRVCIQKSLLFKGYSLIQIIRVFIDMVSTISLISLGFGIYGFVYGTIISTTLYFLLLIVYTIRKTEYRILFHFKFKEIVPFLNFGISISLKKILTEISHRIDEIIIGGTLSSEVLGLYFFGKNLMFQLRILLTSAFGQVLLPVFSKLKTDRNRLREVYTKISVFIGIISFPTFVGVTLTAHIFIPLFFGNEWIGSVDVIRVLSITMIFLVLTANIATSLLYSLNKPGTVLMIDIVTTVLYIISLVKFSEKGIATILLIYSIYIITKTLTLQYYVSKELNYSYFSYFYRFRQSLLSTFIMALIILATHTFISSEFNYTIQLIVSVLVGIMVYTGSEFLIDKRNIKELLLLIKGKS